MSFIQRFQPSKLTCWAPGRSAQFCGFNLNALGALRRLAAVCPPAQPKNSKIPNGRQGKQHGQRQGQSW